MQPMQLDNLIRTVNTYTDSSETASVLTTAFQIVVDAHRGYERINGEPFISHPLAVAETLAKWQAPLHIVAVGLLHDILNLDYSNGYALNSVRKQLGTEIFCLLEEVIALNWTWRDLEADFDAGVDIIAMQHYLTQVLQHNWKIVLVKLIDRLHNLQTISALTRVYQERAARVGFNLLVPLADQLGIDAVKRQLEDYCFEIFNPALYQIQEQQYSDPGFHHDITQILADLQQLLCSLPLKSEIRWQPVSLYTLYCHQIEQNAKLGKATRATSLPLRIVDAGSFVIVTQEEIDCYTLLGLLHRNLPPVEKQFRDFIGSPKENRYRSLHTQIKHASGNPLHVVIRTQAMDLAAEYGITALWRNVPEAFVPSMPKEVQTTNKKMQVFTPKRECIYLPQGASVLDFAYAIHTEIGHHCAGALVNGEQANRYTILSHGDRVEIITEEVRNAPTLDWLEHVQTSQASSQIRQWLTENQRNAMLERGRRLLNKALQQIGWKGNDAHVLQLLSLLAGKEGLERVEDLLVSVGVGRHQASALVEQLKSKRLRSLRTAQNGEPLRHVLILAAKEADRSYTFASCCNPFPPDDIVGHHQSDQELIVHKRGCAQLNEGEKTVQVKWDMSPTEPNYVVVVEASNRPGLASDLSTVMALSGIDMASFSAYERADGVMAEAHIHLTRSTATQRARIKREMERIPYVNAVEIIPYSFFSATMPHLATDNSMYQPNPYGPTVASGPRFYGREIECQRIFTLLRDYTQNTTILLWGQKRIGKTSLVLRLREQLPEDFVPVYIDMQGLRESSTHQFLYRLMSDTSAVFNKRTGQEITVPAFHRIRKDPLAHFDTFMSRIQQAIGERSLIIMLDEFHCLESLREELISREAIFSRLRSHSLHGRSIRFILSGGGLRSKIIEQGNMSSLFNIAHDEKLGGLAEKDGRLLVKSGLAKVGNISDKAIDRLLELTNGHPYYLQLLCSSLYTWAQENNSKITSDIVSQHIRIWQEKADASRFQHLWEGHNLSDSQRNKLILSALAELGARFHEVEYRQLANTLTATVPERDLVLALDNLTNLGIVEHHHVSYKIAIKLFARWMNEHWPLELTLKEID